MSELKIQLPILANGLKRGEAQIPISHVICSPIIEYGGRGKLLYFFAIAYLYVPDAYPNRLQIKLPITRATYTELWPLVRSELTAKDDMRQLTALIQEGYKDAEI